jgi:multicomponent Na+:H+ antiporter subunit D
MAMVYIWKVVEVAYFGTADPDHDVREAPLGMLVPTWALVVATYYFGVDASLTTGVATRAAETLLGVAP